nr:hypothetical protein Itr_chr15CG12250 [Ipomoea trifida]
MSRDGPPPLLVDGRRRVEYDGRRRRQQEALANSPLTLRNDDSKARRWSLLPLCDEQKTEQLHGPPLRRVFYNMAELLYFSASQSRTS